MIEQREKFLLESIAQEKRGREDAEHVAQSITKELKESNEWNKVLCAIVTVLFVFLVFAITHYRKMQYENMLLKEIHHDQIKILKLKNNE